MVCTCICVYLRDLVLMLWVWSNHTLHWARWLLHMGSGSSISHDAVKISRLFHCQTGQVMGKSRCWWIWSSAAYLGMPSYITLRTLAHYASSKEDLNQDCRIEGLAGRWASRLTSRLNWAALLLLVLFVRCWGVCNTQGDNYVVRGPYMFQAQTHCIW